MDLSIGVSSTSSVCLTICFNGLVCLRRQHTCFSKVSLQHKWRNLTTIIHNLCWLMFFIYLLSFNVKCWSSHEMYYNCMCVCVLDAFLCGAQSTSTFREHFYVFCPSVCLKCLELSCLYSATLCIPTDSVWVVLNFSLVDS